MIVCYSGKSAMSARLLAYELRANLTRNSSADINWGRAHSNTMLNGNISNATNKRVMRELFMEHNVPMPKLIPIENVGLYLRTTATPVIGRPDQHSKGRGLWRVHNERELAKALRGTSKKKAATHFMEYVDAPREYQVHIFEGKSIRISEKLFGSAGSTALGSYTTIKPRHDVSHVRKAAKQAMSAIGLDFGAVDVLANDNQAWVLECNSAPHLGGSLPRLYANKFKEWYERAYDGDNR